jgi:hypothetical protein
MAVVGVEASVCLPYPLPIIGVHGPSAITTPLRLPTLLIYLLPKPKPFPTCALALARAPDPLSPPNNGVVVPLGHGLGVSMRSHQARASLPAIRCRGVAPTWP